MTTNPMDDLGYVQNSINTVEANDHNSLVNASYFQYANNLRGYPLGDGRDGDLCLGAITATTTSAPTVAVAGSGNITMATAFYKYSAYNLSGETTESSASTSIALTANSATVTIPGTSNGTNIVGFYVYRCDTSGGTYYRVGQVVVPDATQGATFVDNSPITSGTAPTGSNTTGTSATIEGYYQAKTLTVASGQTITVTTGSVVGLYIVCQGDITLASGSTISGTGVMGSGIPQLAIPSIDGSATGFITLSTSAQSNGQIPGNPILSTSNAIRSGLLRYYNSMGSAAFGAKAGAAVMLICGGTATIAGTVTISGATGTGGSYPADGGGAGGTFAVIAPYIIRNGATVTANGGVGGAGSGSNYQGSGGGGGVIAWISDNIAGSATTSVTGGAAGSGGTGSGGFAGGGNGGAGGTITSSGTVYNAGSVGIVADIPLRTMDLRV